MEEYIGTVASLIGSLTVVGSALLWLYNKFIGAPREKRRAEEERKRHKNMLDIVVMENEPLNKSIQQLTEWLNESRTDRESLHKIAVRNTAIIEDHEERLDDHNNRLITLEVATRIKQERELTHK